MTPKHGTKPRPRVALIGKWPQTEAAALKKLFPPTYFTDQDWQLPTLVDWEELDLIIYGPKIGDVKHAGAHHNIFFASTAALPGIGASTYLTAAKATGNEFLINDGNHPFGTMVRAMAHEIGSAREKDVFVLNYAPVPQTGAETRAWESFIFLQTTRPDGALAAVLEQTVGNRPLGMALLPHASDRLAWVRALCEYWTEIDPDTFGGIGDWESTHRWSTTEEQGIRIKLLAIENERANVLTELDARLAAAEARLLRERDTARKGPRRLITAQGDDLVSAVATVLTDFGFDVDNVDSLIPEGAPRREDLRMRTATQPGWEAIVEVRGYKHGGAAVSDLRRLQRFALPYVNENGKAPDKMIYIINGQFGLPPDRRERPLKSAPEDASVFADSGGLIISTLDLFTLQRDHRNSPDIARDLL